MHRGFLKIATLIASITVGLGAFATHALKGTVSDRAITTMETGIRYQFYHLFALLITAIVYRDFRSWTVLWAGRLFIAGILLFSGSLYYLAIQQAIVQPGYKWIGLITPFGGLCFICGWLLLFLSFFRRSSLR